MDPRKRNCLGHTQVAIDQLALGLVPLGNLYREVSEEQAQATLQAWWDRGLRTFDVAPLYGFGIAERRLGAFLEGRPRGEFVVSTKVGRPIGLGAPPDPDLLMPDGSQQFRGTAHGLNPYRDYSRDGVLRSLDQSLERMHLDRVDYVHIHDPDEYLSEAIGTAYPTLADLRTQGVIGAIGTGVNWSRVAIAMARECDLDCVMLAGRYSIVDQEGLAELLPICLQRSIAVLAGGVLNSGFAADPRPGANFQYRPCYDEALIQRAVGIKATVERHGASMKAAAVQFPFGHPAVASVVIGAGSPEHAEELVEAFQAVIPDAMWEDLLGQGLLPAGTPVPRAEKTAAE